jgi:glycosyltransferase involved in cell wall biosynthesis
MRLLLINYEYPPVGGGAANATAHIAHAMAALGHSPIVLTGAYRSQFGRSRVDGVDIIRVSARRARPDRSGLFEMATYVVAAAFALPRVLRTERPDAAIVFFSMPCGPLGLLAQMWAHIPYVISLRGGDVPGTEASLNWVYTLLTPLRRLVLRKAVSVVANSFGLKALSEATDPVEVEVIPNGVDTDFFRPRERREEPNKRVFTFLFVGRFQAQKNLLFLLDAVVVLRRGAVSPFQVVIVGDGPMGPELRRRCTALGLDEIVTWFGWCSKNLLLAHYQAADCFLNPSLYEGMPNAVLEAMACGLPVVASDVPGNDAVILPGETGFLFEPGDLTQFVALMHRLLAEPMTARDMGGTARTRVAANFSWVSVAEQYVGLLDNASATDPAPAS